MSDAVLEFLTFLLAAVAFVASVFAIYRNEKFISTQNRRQEEFQKSQSEHQRLFETALEQKLLYAEDIKKHFPDLISEFKKNEENYNRIIIKSEDYIPTYSHLKSKIDSGELEFVKKINEELYENLIWVNNEVNNKMQQIRSLKKQSCAEKIDFWASHLIDNYKHGGFGEKSFIERVFWNALPGILEDNLQPINDNFASELKVTLEGNTSFTDPYRKGTPDELKGITTKTFEDFKKLNTEIKGDLRKIDDMRKKMLEIMGNPLPAK